MPNICVRYGYCPVMRGGRGHEQSAVARQELNGRRDGVAEGVAEAAVEASMEYESVVERI